MSTTPASKGKKTRQVPVLAISRKIIQFLSFFLVNYAILEWIFKADFTLLKDIFMALPFLQSAKSAWTAGAGLLEYAFFMITDGRIPFLFLGLIGLFGLFTNRIFCGWMCPTGFIQDLFAGLANENHKFSITVDRGLKKFKLVVLIVFFILIIPLGIYKFNDVEKFVNYSSALGSLGTNPLGPISMAEFFFYTLPTIIQSIVDNAAVSQLFTAENRGQTILFFIYLIIVGLSVYYPRFYCKYLCPYAAAISPVSRYSLFKLRRLPTRCPGRSDCGVCENVCPMQIRILDESYEGFTGKGECTLCMDCVEKCPHRAIRLKFGG